MFERNSLKDAKKVLHNLLPDKHNREIITGFLASAINFANDIDSTNWNLNMDKSGKFIRFNIGQVYCITIRKDSVLVLCFKRHLVRILKDKSMEISFVGYKKSKEIISHELTALPDCLANVPDSVGCLLTHDVAYEYLKIFKEPIEKFINFAIRKTKVRPNMKSAHSSGAVEYISAITNSSLANPTYYLSEAEKNELNTLQDEGIENARKLTEQELERKYQERTRLPQKVKVALTQYVRDPFLSELVKRKAKGICYDCKQPAPFFRKSTSDPYLETHHVIPLSQGGLDVLENVVALCPNCHRKRHYG